MNTDFRADLDNVEPASGFVVSVMIDIRGFTSFCEKVGGLVATTYLVKIYKKIIDEYFTEATFVKPTGDGLLIVYGCTEQELKKAACDKTSICLKLVHDFSSFLEDDLTTRGTAPTKIGVGVSLGDACCIPVNGRVLDYSGRPLNFASRLTDMARPTGVVLDEQVFKALPPELKNRFSNETVFASGICESRPGIQVFYTKDLTKIPDRYKQPLDEPELACESFSKTIKQIRNILRTGQPFAVALKRRTSDPNRVVLRMYFPKSITRQAGSGYLSLGCRTSSDPDVDRALVPLGMLLGQLEQLGQVQDTDNITVEVLYPPKVPIK